MEIRLNCFNSIELNGFTKLKNIKLEILSYDFKNKLLSGDVKTTGEYLKNDDLNPKGFEDIVPFEIMFADTNVLIKNLHIENELFTFKETVGIKMQYEIVVEYEILDEKLDNEEEIIEVPVEIEDTEAVASYNEPVIIDVKKEEDIIENITKEYEIKLEKALKNRNPIIDNKVSFKNQTCTYKTISVYYLNQEKQIEEISREKRISINNLYKFNDDFTKTHRLIVNE